MQSENEKSFEGRFAYPNNVNSIMSMFNMTQHYNDSLVVYSSFYKRSLDELIASDYYNTMKINEWVPRVSGVITFLSALCMLTMAWKRRETLFHRLILGMSLHRLINGAFCMYGTSAIPKSAREEALNAFGTTTTCTVQGFFLYTSGNTAFMYYSFLSVYSYVNVLNNFDKKNMCG